jgi:hypothetical protein
LLLEFGASAKGSESKNYFVFGVHKIYGPLISLPDETEHFKEFTGFVPASFFSVEAFVDF